MRSFSENFQRVNVHFLCTKVVVQKITLTFIRTKNDIGSVGTLS